MVMVNDAWEQWLDQSYKRATVVQAIEKVNNY